MKSRATNVHRRPSCAGNILEAAINEFKLGTLGCHVGGAFFHSANTQKAPTTVYVLASVVVSVIIMLAIEQGAVGMLVGQVILFAAVFAHQKLRMARGRRPQLPRRAP